MVKWSIGARRIHLAGYCGITGDLYVVAGIAGMTFVPQFNEPGTAGEGFTIGSTIATVSFILWRSAFSTRILWGGALGGVIGQSISGSGCSGTR
ncbi:MAG: hypothetical protein U0232_25610 [Thermomicrobiales bacterium]